MDPRSTSLAPSPPRLLSRPPGSNGRSGHPASGMIGSTKLAPSPRSRCLPLGFLATARFERTTCPSCVRMVGPYPGHGRGPEVDSLEPPSTTPIAFGPPHDRPAQTHDLAVSARHDRVAPCSLA